MIKGIEWDVKCRRKPLRASGGHRRLFVDLIGIIAGSVKENKNSFIFKCVSIWQAAAGYQKIKAMIR